MAETKTTPWWSNLIAIFLTAVVSVVGTVYAMRRPSAGEGGTMSTLFKATFSYLPHILLLFGVLGDLFTYEGVYSIPSLIGLLSIFANWLLRYFWDGLFDVVNTLMRPREAAEAALARRAAVPGRPIIGGPMAGGRAADYFADYDGCNIQGLDGWGSKYAPQTLVVTATIFMYYIIDLIDNRGWTNASGAIVGGGVFYAIQSFLLDPKCSRDETEPGNFVRSLISLTEGTLFAGISYGIVKATSPTRLPSSVISPFPRRSRKDLSPGPDGTYVDSDGNPYIVLPNGQAFPDVSNPDSRKDFADIAGENLGTGAPATPSSCKS